MYLSLFLHSFLVLLADDEYIRVLPFFHSHVHIYMPIWGIDLLCCALCQLWIMTG